MALIDINGVTKAFYVDRKKSRAQVALDGLSLSIERGEFVSLIGPSGCGKTVTLSMIAGFASPTIGEVLYKGSPVSGPSPERGVVFQEYSLLPWLSVEQNVAFAVKNSAKRLGREIDSASALARSSSALARVGLASVSGHRPNTLSGGMKQRVAIARLLAMDSDVFLMDEPFSALDEQTRGSLDTSFHELWKREGKTVVFVTHNISEAVRISSRIVLFSASPGKVIAEWRVPEGFDRDPDGEQSRSLAQEIRANMPLSPCAF